MKIKTSLIIIALISTIIYYYATIYIPYYAFNFDLIDINKRPDLWKWSPSILTFISSVTILSLAILCLKIYKALLKPEPSLQTTKTYNKYYLLCASVIGGFLFVTVQYLISILVFGIPSWSPKEFELWYLPVLTANALIYPIAEEVFFRKGIFNLLKSNFHLYVSLALSSILFSVIHLPNYSQVFYSLIAGFILATLYNKTDKILYPILFHVSWNSTIIIASFIS